MNGWPPFEHLIAACISSESLAFDLIFEWISKSEKPVFVNNRQEFLSIWSIAHALEGLDPELTNVDDIPASIQASTDVLMLAYFCKEIIIRRSNGYRLIGHNPGGSSPLITTSHTEAADPKGPAAFPILICRFTMRALNAFLETGVAGPAAGGAQ